MVFFPKKLGLSLANSYSLHLTNSEGEVSVYDVLTREMEMGNPIDGTTSYLPELYVKIGSKGSMTYVIDGIIPVETPEGWEFLPGDGYAISVLLVAADPQAEIRLVGTDINGEPL
jgi:hypothetical protein